MKLDAKPAPPFFALPQASFHASMFFVSTFFWLIDDLMCFRGGQRHNQQTLSEEDTLLLLMCLGGPDSPLIRHQAARMSHIFHQGIMITSISHHHQHPEYSYVWY